MTTQTARPTSRDRFAAAAAEHGWTITHGDQWIVTYRKGRREVYVQFAVGGPGDRPVRGNASNSRRAWQWAGRQHSGPLVDWVLAELTR